MNQGRNPKPKHLQFRIEGKEFHGVDPIDGADYRIGWCGNGSYSHYTLNMVSDPDKGWYVYVNEKDELYRSIYAAERQLVYNVEKP